MEIKLYNTMSRKKEVFKPIKKGEVGLYSCGPTVYNYAHIGNLRAYVFNDVLKRTLLYNGFKVKHVMNITDVGHLESDADEGEDKMEKGARREGKTVWEVAEFYTKAFFSDIKKLNILKPDITPKATEHVKDMIATIQKLEKNGHTYVTGGNVYYDVSTFKDYGKLARLKLENLKAGARIKVDQGKRNPQDFVLWFTKSKFKQHAMMWDSPWGRGYPGWHIECSSMSSKYLGEHFDIHTGGIDHIPVHHTNEIAQAEGASGKKWVNFWLHNEFLVLDKGKMAKSGESFIIMKTLEEKGYDPIDYRYLCLTAQYRQQLSFSWEALDSARNSFASLKSKVIEIKEKKDSNKTKKYDKYKKDFLEKIDDDLNTPQALAVLWDVIKGKELGSKEKYELILDFDKVLGLALDKLKKEKVAVPEEVMKLVKKREELRKNNKWEEADKVRDKIKEKGYVLDDTKEGTVVKKA